MDLEDVDLDAAMDAVVADMGRAAKEFKGKKYAPKPEPKAAAPEAPPAEDESGMPTEGELESLLRE